MDNCYDILGVEKNASQDEIKKRFRELTLQYHPDKSKSGNAHDKFLRIKLAYETLSNPEKRRLHDIQIYGTDESYTEASTPYGDTGFTEERYQEIYEATKVHLYSLRHVVTTFFSWLLKKLNAGGQQVDANDFANALLEWYHGIDSEVFSHCQRISLLLPDTHDVLIKEFKKIQKISSNHVETVTKELVPGLVNIKKGNPLSPSQNSKYSTTTDFVAEEIALYDNYVKMWVTNLEEAVEVLRSLDSPNPKKLGQLVTKTIDYPKRMQMTVSFIDDWIDILTLKYYQKMDLQKKLKQPKEEESKEEPKDHVVTFADVLMEENR